MNQPLLLSGSKINTVRLVEVVEITFPRGAGVEGDPVRIVTQYWMAGSMLAEIDPFSTPSCSCGTCESVGGYADWSAECLKSLREENP